MKLKTKIALKLAKELKLELSGTQLDDTKLYYMEEGELQEGCEVFVMDEEGAYVLPEDGEYAYGDKTVVVASGVVTAISENAGKKGNKKGKGSKKQEKSDSVNLSDGDIKAIAKLVAELSAKQRGDDLNLIKAELSEVKKKLKLTSAGKFEQPNPLNSETRKESQLTKFGL